jgi:hypothetical protein
MAQIVKLKRSSTKGNVPTTTQIELGELAINTNDGKLYFERNDGSATIQTILTSNTVSPITGSFQISSSADYTLGVTGSLKASDTGSFGYLLADGNITASYYYGDGSKLDNVSGEDPNSVVFSIVFGG